MLKENFSKYLEVIKLSFNIRVFYSKPLNKFLWNGWLLKLFQDIINLYYGKEVNREENLKVCYSVSNLKNIWKYH